jgi:hypothetical protein
MPDRLAWLRRLRARFATDRHGRRRPRVRGQAFVEFAMLLPVFLLLTIGVVDLARIFSSYIALTDGVREAALFAAEGDGYDRWCAVPPDDTIACPTGAASHQAPDPDNIAYQIQFDAADLDPAEIEMLAPVCDPDPCAGNSTVTIVVSYRLPILTPVLSDLLGGDLAMTASTTAAILP